MNTTSIHTGAFKSVPLLNDHPVDMLLKKLLTSLQNQGSICPKSIFMIGNGVSKNIIDYDKMIKVMFLVPQHSELKWGVKWY